MPNFFFHLPSCLAWPFKAHATALRLRPRKKLKAGQVAGLSLILVHCPALAPAQIAYNRDEAVNGNAANDIAVCSKSIVVSYVGLYEKPKNPIAIINTNIITPILHVNTLGDLYDP